MITQTIEYKCSKCGYITSRKIRICPACTKSKNFVIGDTVYSKKGCRIKGNPGALEVIEVGKSWGEYSAILCKKLDGTLRLFLEKNLVYRLDKEDK
jgi:hypothetical protein